MPGCAYANHGLPNQKNRSALAGREHLARNRLWYHHDSRQSSLRRVASHMEGPRDRGTLHFGEIGVRAPGRAGRALALLLGFVMIAWARSDCCEP
jgi:hypothetical protein